MEFNLTKMTKTKQVNLIQRLQPIYTMNSEQHMLPPNHYVICFCRWSTGDLAFCTRDDKGEFQQINTKIPDEIEMTHFTTVSNWFEFRF